MFAPSEMLHAGLHERGGCAGAGVSIMVLVVSTLFPKFLSPFCLSEGGGKSPFTLVCREQRSTFSLTEGKS